MSSEKNPRAMESLSPAEFIDKGWMIRHARVATQDQDLELQMKALRKAGCQKVLKVPASGSRTERLGPAQTWENLRVWTLL